MRLENKTAVITGVNSGIGREAAILFASEGANVVGVDINTTRMKELADAIIEAGHGFLGCECDIRDYQSVKKVFSRAYEEFGQIDIVLNVAGVSTELPVTRITSDEYQRVMDINVKGVFNFCKGAASYMKKQKHGVLINTSSVTGIYGTGIGCPYPASKAAIIGLTKSLAIELAPWKIRVNSVAPGVVATEMVAGLDERAKKAFAKTIPLKRLGHAKDIANAMLFLASNEADYITGTVICVDGGYRPSTVNM
ncbi:MAG: SDR family NAD(P)-dependent oxidoreductase [Hespellia sp.]|nr:SDR family NAD(P)-dependent oxidoreductase [Hespellia sp.]